MYDPGEDLLAPGFIDLPVKRGGVLFNDVLSGLGWHALPKRTVVSEPRPSLPTLIVSLHPPHVLSGLIFATIAGQAGPAPEARTLFLLVSDAVSPVGAALGEFMLDGGRVLVRKGRLEAEENTLAVVCTDVCGPVRLCAEPSGLALEGGLRLASTSPSHFVGVPDRGPIEVGAWVDLV